MTAIMPAQVRKPKQKASAEGTVKDAATWVIATLRNRVFASFDEVKVAVSECLLLLAYLSIHVLQYQRDKLFLDLLQMLSYPCTVIQEPRGRIIRIR